MNVKQFKRIGAAVDEPLPTGDEMTLALTETLANKLEIRRTLLATELGFDVTNEMVLAFLLRDIKDVVPEWQKEAEALMRERPENQRHQACARIHQYGTEGRQRVRGTEVGTSASKQAIGMTNKSTMYHLILDLLDSEQHTRAAHELQSVAPSLTTQEFSLLINAFVRRGIEVRTV
jgi:hypothetical protein